MINLFDRYDWIARIYPAFLTLLPVIVLAFVLYPKGLSLNLLAGNTVLGLFSFCVIYLLASIARYRGERIEERLLRRWGGWPTTIMLRHRDPAVDPSTKARYHAALRTLHPTVVIPTEDEENERPAEADDLYRSATLRLIEQRRGPAYALLQGENASYGFRRNMLGMRSIGIVVGVATALGAALVWAESHPNLTLRMLMPTVFADWPLPALVAFDLIWIVFWFAQIKEHFVLQAGQDYATALLRTLDA